MANHEKLISVVGDQIGMWRASGRTSARILLARKRRNLGRWSDLYKTLLVAVGRQEELAASAIVEEG